MVATDIGGLSQAVEDGQNGLLFPLGSVAGLGRMLRRLVEEPGLIGRLKSGIGRVKQTSP